MTRGGASRIATSALLCAGPRVARRPTHRSTELAVLALAGALDLVTQYELAHCPVLGGASGVGRSTLTRATWEHLGQVCMGGGRTDGDEAAGAAAAVDDAG